MKNIEKKREVFGRCPICGEPILKGKRSWFCSNYIYGCTFRLYKEMRRFEDTIYLTDETVREILKGNTFKATLTSEKKRRFGANLRMVIRNKYVNFRVDSLIK